MPSEIRLLATVALLRSAHLSKRSSICSTGPIEVRLWLLIMSQYKTELLQAGIYIIYYYSQNSDHVKLQLDADHRRAACYVLSATVIGTAPNCNTNKC